MPNPKNYPFWKELIELLPEARITQIGSQGEEPLVSDCRFGLTLEDLKKLVATKDTWISVDSFLPHLAHHIPKPGIVIFSVSDPDIFGYKENVNLLRDRRYLRKNQFDTWESHSFVTDAFVNPGEVVKALRKAT